jgi:hypothetical protein
MEEILHIEFPLSTVILLVIWFVQISKGSETDLKPTFCQFLLTRHTTVVHNCVMSRVCYYARVCRFVGNVDNKTIGICHYFVLWFYSTTLFCWWFFFLKKVKLCYRVILLVVSVFKVFPREHFKNKQYFR